MSDARMWVGDASNTAQPVQMNGDASMTNAGLVTIANDAVTTAKILNANVTNAKLSSDAVTTVKIADDQVTFAKLQNISTNRMLGRSTASAGDVEEIILGAGLSLSGGTLAASGSGTALNNAFILVGDAANLAAQVAMSGDATISNTGALTLTPNAVDTTEITNLAVTTGKIADDNVTFAKFQNINTNRILGRSTAASGDMEEIFLGSGLSLANGTLASTSLAAVTGSTLTNARMWVGDASNTAQPVQMNGDASMTNAGLVTIANDAVTTAKILNANVTNAKLAADVVTTVKIADDQVTFAKMQNVNTNRMLGRSTAAAGDVEEIVLGAGLSLSGGTLAASGSGTALNNAFILVGDAANLAAQVAMSGDATNSNTGAVTLTPN
ncbi:MAG: hypothetical protein AAB263_16480, partial [Planctomycetota bacterium]